MTCREFERLLAEGRPLTAEAEKHLAECPGCRSLLEALNRGAALESLPMQGFPNVLLQPLTAVKPLASDTVLTSLTMAGFVAFCLLVTAFFGFAGFVRLSVPQRLAYYGPVTLFGLLFSIAAVQSAIPGAKVRVRRGLVITGAVLTLSALALALFPHFELDAFVRRGIPCLRLGCLCAALFGAAATLALRRGYVTDPRTASLLVGCFAGFSGVAVLSLHCPIPNAFHIIVWHLGAIAVSALAGSLIGLLVLKRAR